MSMAGVGNAAAGNGLVMVAKHLLTKEENRPATKGDLKRMSLKWERYQFIKNMNPNIKGQKPYFDNELGFVVYR